MSGTPLLHAFQTTAVFPNDREIGLVEPADFHMSMDLNGRQLRFGQGLAEGKQINGSAVVVLAVHNPYELGLGEHPFHLTVTGNEGQSYLDLEGVVEVVANDSGSTTTPGQPLWFDALSPSSPQLTAGSNMDELPKPEVPVAIRDQRLSVCMECPAFNKESGECAECGCFMPYKTGLIHSSCPLHKWGAYVEG